MAERIVLVSDDSDFFEYILPKIRLRNSDEIFRFNFDELPQSIDKLGNALYIINSESSKIKTIQLLNLLNGNPAVVFGYNDDEDLKSKLYSAGMNSYVTPSISDNEFNARLLSCLKIVSSMNKNKMYRELLVDNNIVNKNNEVFLDSNSILDRELKKIRSLSINAVLAAIAPDEKQNINITKNKIETEILNNVRSNDILMNFAPNKYFLLLYNTDLKAANLLWDKIRVSLPANIYAGFVTTGSKTRQELVSEVLNKLHQNINNYPLKHNNQSETNFKLYRQEFNKNFEQIINPVFFQIHQYYSELLYGIRMEQDVSDGTAQFIIKSKHAAGCFKISAPGLSKINIDITYFSDYNSTDSGLKPESQRITLEPHEFEAGILQDLLERFILDFKNEVKNDNIE